MGTYEAPDYNKLFKELFGEPSKADGNSGFDYELPGDKYPPHSYASGGTSTPKNKKI